MERLKRWVMLMIKFEGVDKHINLKTLKFTH